MFRLALALGQTVAELEETIGSAELTEWAAYYKIEPFGQFRDNYHAGQIASILANRWRGKSDPIRTVDDFIYREPSQAKAHETQKTLSALNSYAVKKAKK